MLQQATPQRSAVPAQIFFLAAAGVVVISTLIVRSAAFAREPEALAMAVTLDLAVLVPGLYLIAAGRMGWPRLSAIPVALLCFTVARVIVPAPHQPGLAHGELLLLPIELCLIGLLVHKVRRVARGYGVAKTGTDDVVAALDEALSETVRHPRLVQVLVTELSMLYYGLLSWRAPRHRDPDTEHSYHRGCSYGALVGVLLLLVLVEAGVLHLLLISRISWLAWTLSAVSLYSCGFLVADLKAACFRPIEVTGGVLHINVGLRWRISIPLADIERVEQTTLDIEDRNCLLFGVLAGNQNLVLHLARLHTATGCYGISKRCNRIALAVDEPERFVRALDPA